VARHDHNEAFPKCSAIVRFDYRPAKSASANAHHRTGKRSPRQRYREPCVSGCGGDPRRLGRTRNKSPGVGGAAVLRAPLSRHGAVRLRQDATAGPTQRRGTERAPIGPAVRQLSLPLRVAARRIDQRHLQFAAILEGLAEPPRIVTQDRRRLVSLRDFRCGLAQLRTRRPKPLRESLARAPRNWATPLPTRPRLRGRRRGRR
jgi:hypothetical protein